MAIDLFAAAIINFCGLKNPDDLSDGATRACADFMTNCIVDNGGSVTDDKLKDCKVQWTLNAQKLIKKSLED